MKGSRLLFTNLEYFTPVIVATVRAGAMRHLGFMTVGTFGGRADPEKVMGAPFIPARF